MSLSVVVITKNEAAVIRRCLESVGWADEIVVLDAGSSDDTARLAREWGAKVSVAGDWPGFGPQKTARWRLQPATGCSRLMPTNG